MTGTDLRGWRKRLGLTRMEAGVALALSYRCLENYEAGHAFISGGKKLVTIPRTVELACEALETRHNSVQGKRVIVLLGADKFVLERLG